MSQRDVKRNLRAKSLFDRAKTGSPGQLGQEKTNKWVLPDAIVVGQGRLLKRLHRANSLGHVRSTHHRVESGGMEAWITREILVTL